MKKRSFIIVVAVSVVALITLVGFSMRSAQLVNTQTIDSGTIESLKINYNSDSIHLYKSDSDQVVIKEYLASGKQQYLATIKTNGNEATVTGGKRDAKTGVLVQNSKIEIYLPKSYHGDLGIALTSGSFKVDESFRFEHFEGQSSSGTFNLNKIKAKELIIENTSGSIKANRLNAKKLKLICRSGSLKIGDSIADQLISKTTSGSLTLSKIRGDATIEATSGSINVDEFDGLATLKTTSGSINASFVRVQGDIKAEATSGSVKLRVPQKTTFNFSGEVTSGGLHTDFDDLLKSEDSVSKATVGSKPAYDMTTKVTSGSLTIRFL